MAPKKPTKKAESAHVEVLSDKEIVLKQYDDAECWQFKVGRFVICTNMDGKEPTRLHSGLAGSESEAWKLAAHAVL